MKPADLLRQGLAQERSGDLTAALAAYRAAAHALPSSEEAHYRAANLLEFTGALAPALEHFRRGAAARSALGKLCAGRAALLRGDPAGAIRHFRNALARDPGNTTAADWLGTTLADTGDFTAAFTAFATAVREPALAGSFYDMVRCRTITPGDARLIAAIDAALANPGLDAQTRLRCHLARGKAADDLEDPALAMRHYDAAAQLRATVAPFDPGAFDQLVDRIAAAFPAGRVPPGAAPALPILVIGMPRSGTTLVEQILAAHPQVAAGGELGFWNERGARWPSRDEAGFIAAAGAEYLALLRGMANGRTRVTDKMPFNFLWAGLILCAVPGAVIVHCRRAAIDTAVSIHQTHFNPLLRFPTGGAALVRYFAAYRRLVAHWRAALPAGRFIDISYEALVAGPEPEIRRLLAACDLDFDPACLHPERNRSVIRTPSKWQARQAIHAGSVQRWRRYAGHLGPLGALAT